MPCDAWGRHFRGVVRILPSNPDDCSWSKAYHPRTDFKILRGGEYLVGGDVIFPLALQRFLPVFDDGYYRTAFFANIDHNGRIYADCDQSLRYAARRLLAYREPPEDFEVSHTSLQRHLNWHAYSRYNQETFIKASRLFLKMLRFHMADAFNPFTTLLQMARDFHDMPHDKRELRIQAWIDLCESGDVATGTWLRKVLYKLKKFEWAKPGKYPRAIGDLGVSASLLGFMLTEYLKAGMAREPFYYLDSQAEFVKKPTQKLLVSTFEKLIDPPKRIFFAYFSDDSCISIRVGAEVYVYNVDISSCDASHGPELFEAMCDIVPEGLQSDMRRLVKQLTKTVYLASKSKVKKERIYLKMDEPTLFSGSTLTTVLNNLACLLMFRSFAETQFTGSRTDVKDQLIAAAESAGYKITIDVCLKEGHIQFLKNSPVKDIDGKRRALLNVGVLLRMTGVCHGDLPGRGPLEERARNFQANLLRGAYPRAHFTLVDAMKQSAGGVTSELEMNKLLKGKLNYKVVLEEEDEEFSVDSFEICKRYDMDLGAYQELEELLGGAGFGEVVSCEAADTILETDYKLRVSY